MIPGGTRFALQAVVSNLASYLRAFGSRHTYSLRRNGYLWFGILWGLPIPVVSIALDLSLAGVGGRSPVDALQEHPIHFLFLAHPALFGLAFGAMGTVRHHLELENERLIGTLRSLAITDSLTGLYNRRYVLEALKNAIHRSDRSGEPVCAVLFDLDGFKLINDRQGHLAGDRALRDVARALGSVLRQGDTLGRYGGDEFLLVVHGDLDSADGLMERAREAVLRDAGISVSAGTARYPADGSRPEAVVEAADTRLADVKRKRHELQGTGRR